MHQLDYNKILQTYPLIEIIERNDRTEDEVLEFLVEQGYLRIPNPRPLNFDD